MKSRIEQLVRYFLGGVSDALAQRYAAPIAQFFKFGIVGLSNTLVGYAINVLVLLILQSVALRCDYVIANVVSFLVSVLWSFYWNNKYVFTVTKGEQRVWWKALLKTYLSYAFTGILLNNILSWLWIEKLSVSKYIAPLINLIVSAPVNFLLNKFWAFQNTAAKKG